MVSSSGQPGLFLAFEGGEGSGKSTQTRLLGEWLTRQGREAVLTREPGGTDVGAALRRILLDPATGELSARTEALVYLADKAEHVDHLIVPALERGAVVVTDRYVDSMLAYQGAGRALSVAELDPIAHWATAGLRPDLTIVLDVDPTIGLARAGAPDRIEAEPLAFHERVRDHFLALAAAEPGRYVVISAAQTPDQIAGQIREAVTPWLARA